MTNIHINQTKPTEPQDGIQPEQPVVKKNEQQLDATIIAYMMILEAVKIQRDSAELQSSYLEANAQAQQQLIDEQSQLQYKDVERSALYHTVYDEYDSKYYSSISGGSSHASAESMSKMGTSAKILGSHEELKDDADITLRTLELENQLVAQKISFIDDKFSLARQRAQLSETDLNTDINKNQQAVQEGSSLLQMLTSLTQLINR